LAISSSIRKSGPFSGNGHTTGFPFGFKIFDGGDLRVVRSDAGGTEAVLLPGYDFNVTVNEDQDTEPGGTIELTAPLAAGYFLTLTSGLDALQPTVLTNSGGFYPDVLNDSLDRLTILTQQLRETVSRAIVSPVAENTGATLPSASARAGKLAWFDAAGRLAGWEDTGAVMQAFDAVLAGTQPLLTLIGQLEVPTLAEAIAGILASADLYDYGRFGVDLSFSTAAGGPLYRMAGDQRAVATDLAAFRFTRATDSYALDGAGTLTRFAPGVPRVMPDGLHMNIGVTNRVLNFTDYPIGLVGLDQGGGNNAIVSLVDDTAALTAAGLQDLVPSGKVIRIDNSGYDSSATVYFKVHPYPRSTDVYYQGYLRVEAAGQAARMGLDDLAGVDDAETATTSTTYVPVGNNVTTSDHDDTSRIYAKASGRSIAYVTLPYLGPGVFPPVTPAPPRNPGTFTGIPSANLALTVLDPTSATANITRSGNPDATLTLFDDNAAIPMQSIIPSKATAKVYRLNNTFGSDTGDAYATFDCAATVSGTSYQVYAFMRVVSDGTAYVQFKTLDVAQWSDDFWTMIGATSVAGTTADKIAIRAPKGVIVDFVQLIVEAGTSLPPALAPWALTDTVIDGDNATLLLPDAYNDLVVTWGEGLQTVVPAGSGSADIGAAAKRPWLGFPVDNIRSLRKGATANLYTPPAAYRSSWDYTRHYRDGSTYDPTVEFPILAFSDDFMENHLTDSSDLSGTAKWFGPGHTTFGFAAFKRPSEAPSDTYTIADGKLRIRMQKTGDVWTTGSLSSINDAGQGFTFTKGYAEIRMLHPGAVGAHVPGAWGAFWATNQMPGQARPHAEIDFIELYGTNPENWHSALHIHPQGHAHPLGFQHDAFINDPVRMIVLDGDYHTYGCAVTDSWIIHYFDRKEVTRAPYYGECRLAPFHLLLNLAGNWAEIDDATSPIDLYVDYVKVWTE
jgi:hypothetical protein